MKTIFSSLRGLASLAIAAAIAFAPIPALAQNQVLPGTIIVQPGSVTSGAGGVSYAGTINNKAMLFTTEVLTIAAGGSVDFTITNNAVSATDLCTGTILTAATGKPIIQKIVPAAGSLVVTVTNLPTVVGNASITTAMVLGVVCFK